MNSEELLKRLHEMTPIEQFYREYRLARQSPIYFCEYLENLDMAYVWQHKILIPEMPETVQESLNEMAVFPAEKSTGIFVSKHACYTPQFLHNHDFYEMFFVYEGSCVHNIGSQSTLLRAGDCCLILPGVFHAIDVCDESVIINVLIRKSTFQQYFNGILQSDNILSTLYFGNLYAKAGMDYIIFHAQSDSFLRGAFLDAFMECENRGMFFCEMECSIVLRIFVLLLRNHMDDCELPKASCRDSERAAKYVQFIQANYASITLDMFAENFHYTPEHASRSIRQVTGRTYSELLRSVRMEAACQLLCGTNLSVQRVSDAVGYSNPEHFIRMFRKEKGLTPSAYRRNR